MYVVFSWWRTVTLLSDCQWLQCRLLWTKKETLYTENFQVPLDVWFRFRLPRPHYAGKIWKRNFIVTDTPSVHTNTHKKIHENGTFWKRSPEWNNLKTILFVLVSTENFLYPQLFEYADVILSCNLSSQVINMAKNMTFWNFESKQPPETL